MKLAVCAPAIANAAVLAASGLDAVEENVQAFLRPADADDAAFSARLAASRAAVKPVRSANAFLPAELPCVGPQVDRVAVRAWTATACRRAQVAGIRTIVFGSSGARRIPAGFSVVQATAQFIDLLRELGPIAHASGVTLVIEPLCQRECNLINTLAEGAEVVRTAAVPGVRLLADLYHMGCAGEGPAEILAVGDVLAHVHISAPDRSPPGSRGDDMRPFFAALAEICYAGDIAFECNWQDMASQLAASVIEVRRQLADARHPALMAG